MSTFSLLPSLLASYKSSSYTILASNKYGRLEVGYQVSGMIAAILNGQGCVFGAS